MAVTTKTLASTAVRSVQWTTAATVLTAVLQIGYTAVTARLLGYGSRVSVVSGLKFINGKLDTLLIGCLMGAVPLGISGTAVWCVFLPHYPR